MINTKKIVFKTLISLSFVFAFVLINSEAALAADCGGAVKCECGDMLVESQTMWYDLGVCPGAGLYIETPNITLDCNNHVINGTDDSYWGIMMQGASDYTTVTNCNINNFEINIYNYYRNNPTFTNNNFSSGGFGINSVGGNNILIENNVVNNAEHYGIAMGGSSANVEIKNNNLSNNDSAIVLNGLLDSNITNNIFENNRIYGIKLRGTNNTLFENNKLNNNAYGVDITTSNNNNFTNNEIISNHYVGLKFNDANDQNNFWNNIIINARNFRFNYYSGINNFHTTTSGNFWGDFESNPGYPNYYEIYPEQNDIYPNQNIPTGYCGGPTPCQCGDILYGDYTMSYDLTCDDTALIIDSGLLNLDCAGYSISGTGNGSGILNQGSYSSISNCNIDNFFYGIYAMDNSGLAQSSELLKNYPFLNQDTVKKTSLFEKYLNLDKSSSDLNLVVTHNTYTSNTISNNVMEGLILSGITNIVDSNTFYGNGNVGLYVRASSSQFLNNTSTDNSWLGILNDGNNNIYTANNISSNQIGIYGLGDYTDYTTNNIYSNDIGIKNFRDYNDFTLNNFYNNSEFGLEFVNDHVMEVAENNIAWDNSFINNGQNAKDEGINNLFSTATTGNFWDDLVLNSGYPNGQYNIPTNGVDYFPISDYVDVDEDGYLFHISEDFEGEDCDDTNPNVNPGMLEIIFNGIDDNCNGRVDEHYKPRILFMREEPIEDGGFWR